MAKKSGPALAGPAGPAKTALISKIKFKDIQKSNYGYPKIHFWISLNAFLDIY